MAWSKGGNVYVLSSFAPLSLFLSLSLYSLHRLACLPLAYNVRLYRAVRIDYEDGHRALDSYWNGEPPVETSDWRTLRAKAPPTSAEEEPVVNRSSRTHSH